MYFITMVVIANITQKYDKSIRVVKSKNYFELYGNCYLVTVFVTITSQLKFMSISFMFIHQVHWRM